MRKTVMTLAVIMSLTFSINGFSSDRSLKGSSLENDSASEGKKPQQQQDREIDDMRTLVGGSLGGAESGSRPQQREEERKSDQPLVTCKEAMEMCQEK